MVISRLKSTMRSKKDYKKSKKSSKNSNSTKAEIEKDKDSRDKAAM
jgi:hypothetical protein